MSVGDFVARVLIAAAIITAAAMVVSAAESYEVGERAPSPSPGVPHASRADSEAAPARPLETVELGGGPPGEDGSGWTATWIAGSPTAASTVTTQALVASPSATAYLVIDSDPATPSAKFSPPSNTDYISALIAASPWPQYLWGTVACLVERESKGNAGAVGLAGERGLLQAHPITWPYLAQYGITPDALFDPATNLRAGYLLFIEAGGLRPWNGGCA